MKKQIVVIALLLSGLSLQAPAQVSVSFNLNAQPVWGPVGYDRADYYYMPDIETYYSVSRRQYTYFDGGRWVSSGALPPRYRGYDEYHGYKAVINEPNPWMHNDRYRSQYGQYRGRHDQAFIRDSRDERYYANPGHPQHDNWARQHNQGRPQGGGDYRHDNGNHGGGQGNQYQGRGDGGHGNQGRGDGGHGNQGHGDQGRGDGGHGNQGRGDQGHGNQGHGDGGHGDQGRGGEGHGNGGHGDH